MKAGVIGLGAMGSGIARNLARAGHLATVWNRTAATAQTLAAELDVPVAPSPEGLAGSCDVVITSVAADDDVLEMVGAMLPALVAGQVVVDTSTVSTSTVSRAAGMVASAGARFLDAPVSGGREGAQNGTLMIMVGGEAEALERVMPALEAISRSVVHMGDSGKGQATKAVNQVMAAGVIQAVSDGMAFGQAMGLDMDKVVEVTGGGAAGSWLLQQRGASMVRGEFEPGFKCALHHKDLAICRAMLDELGVALPTVEMTVHHYERLMAAGFGEEDISTLFRLKRELFETGNKRSL